ncbi:hypothetical protein BGW80DRAFT_1463627 [Lactifluus volemus]|nr:hypothetical protein BGW80DRAFT_1463627 [Lactifluus volemus]
MTDFFVGPMPVKEFLDKFLPRDKIASGSNCSIPSPFEPGCFSETFKAKSELDAYSPFIKACRKLVPGLIFVDSHSRGDTSGPLLKPDVSVYAIQENKANDYKGIDCCIMSLLDIHIEFKWSTTEEPFIKHPTATSLVANTGNARDTLGQLSTYAAAQLAAQYRTHAFSIFVLRKKARII